MPTDQPTTDLDVPTDEKDEASEDEETGSENAETELIRRENLGRRGRPPRRFPS